MDNNAAPFVSQPPARDWSLLPLDILSSIFARIGPVDVLMGAGLACRWWLEASKLPYLWRAVDMDKHEAVFMKDDDVLCAMAKAAVERSDGQLRSFAGRLFVTGELMEFIVQRSPCLSTLRLVSCNHDVFSERVIEVIKESPLRALRSLELVGIDITVEGLTTVLENCPALEVLRAYHCFRTYDEDEHALRAKFARIRTFTLKCNPKFRFCNCHFRQDLIYHD